MKAAMFFRRAAAAGVALLAAACSTQLPAPSLTGTPSAGAPLDSYATVLQRYVDDRGRTDFQGVARDRAALDTYVSHVYRTSPESNPEQFPTQDARLAYYLNSYNALAMYNVVQSGIPASLGGLKKVGFFYFTDVEVGGKTMSLYDYENDVIRQQGEERVHFALNCMAAGCPRLPRYPFPSENLDAELDKQARFFFSEPRNLRVDPDKKTVYVSEILSFFTKDFLKKKPTLIAYVNQYVSPPIPDDYKVDFIPYDWTINNQPKNLTASN
jgi:Protein of unknown function, DUF547